MREIQFRGRDIETGEWLYGKLFTHVDWAYIITSTVSGGDVDRVGIEYRRVDKETVGQYISEKDIKGDEICEGDVLVGNFKWGSDGGCVEYKMGCFYLNRPWEGSIQTQLDIDFSKYEIAGNVHDNPELLEEK